MKIDRNSLGVAIASAVAIIFIAATMPRISQFEYSYQKGSTWNYETLVAPFSFPILKTQEQILAEKQLTGSTYVPYYKYDDAVFDDVEAALRTSLSDRPEVVARAIPFLSGIYSKGVLPSETAATSLAADEDQLIVFVQKDKRAIKTPREELYTTVQLYSMTSGFLERSFPGLNVDSLLLRVEAYSVLAANLVFDKQTTELVHQESSEFISPTSGVFRAGDIIVSSGEIITASIAQILDSYKTEFQNNMGASGSPALSWLGKLILAIVFVSMVECLIWFSRKKLFSHINEFCFILCILCLSSLVTFLLSSGRESLLYVVPYPVFALYLMAFFRKKLVLPLYILCLVPILVVFKGGSHVFLTFVFAGCAGMLSFEKFNRGWKQFLTCVFIFLAMTVCYIALRIFGSASSVLIWNDILMMFLGSLFCALAYPLIYLFEIIFNLLSSSRLDELADPQAKLMRELAQKAPGTFQHSLAVMNMCDAAARSIDADVHLVRAGAMYHDIGKTLNPGAFVENMGGAQSPHDSLSPMESAQMIIRHVSDGVTLAEKFSIPFIIREFISCHHGTSTAGYFYTRFLNEGGDKSEIAQFTYPGPKPRTKEQVILMLCDSLEAASRTLGDFSSETVSAFVDKIYMDKYNNGQYGDADITLQELETVKQAMKTYIVQLHHNRIEYPKRKILNK